MRPRHDFGSSRRQFLATLRQLLPLAFTLILLLLVFGSSLFRVKTVECRASNGSCTARHWEILNLQQGKLILFIKPAVIEKQLEEDPSLKSATVTTRLLHTLSADLELENKLLPVGFIPVDPKLIAAGPESSLSASPILNELTAVTGEVGNWYRLSSRGDLLPSEAAIGNVFILDQQQPQLSRLVALYRLYYLLERQGVTLSKLWLSGDHAGLITSSGTAVFVGIGDDLDERLTTLQQILFTTTIDLTRAVVDLRFTNPVVLKNDK